MTNLIWITRIDEQSDVTYFFFTFKVSCCICLNQVTEEWWPKMPGTNAHIINVRIRSRYMKASTWLLLDTIIDWQMITTFNDLDLFLSCYSTCNTCVLIFFCMFRPMWEENKILFLRGEYTQVKAHEVEQPPCIKPIAQYFHYFAMTHKG